MKRFALLFVVVALGLLGCAFRCPAQCFNSGYRQVYAPPVVVREVVKVVEVPVVAVPVLVTQVAVPVYSTGYVPPAVPAPVASQATAAVPAANPNAEVIEALRAISRRLDALERGGAVPAPVMPSAEPQANAATGAPNALALYQSRCAACHTEGKPFTSGTRSTTLALFKPDGSPVKLASAVKFNVSKAMRAGTMPLVAGTLAPQALKNEEYDVLQDFVNNL